MSESVRDGASGINCLRVRGAMLWVALLCAAPAVGAPPEPSIYRIELKSGAVVWAQDRPRESGTVVLFHLHPRGAWTSVRRSEVVRIVAAPLKTPAAAALGLKPGEQVILGATGSGATRAAEASPPGGPTALRPGERRDGTALFNPDRPYRPDWDSKQVPGQNMPFPASPNDYREGRTIAYPPASAVQSAPGQPPMMPPSTGDVPR